MKQLAVLISNAGTGSNLQAIIDAINNEELSATIALVVSDTDDAQGLKRAKDNNIPILIVKKGDDMTSILKKHNIDYVVLAGWKQIISSSFIDAFENCILNLHPGLIPDKMDGVVTCPDGSKGLWNKGAFTEKAIQNFLDKKATFAGSTVHLLSHEFDFGPVLERCFVKIESSDTVGSLYDRLKKEEHKIYIKALKRISNF